MTRSQRHRIYIQGSDVTGKGLAEGQPAIVYIQQAAAVQPFAVPVGPTGGTLKGSTLAGYYPTSIPAPKLMEADAPSSTQQQTSLPAGGSNPETPANPEPERTFPMGPFTINRIEDHPGGISVLVVEGDIRVGDTVLIEATGNTSINGQYPVLEVNGLTVVVDNPVVLTSPIDAKGRLTVVS